MLQEPARELIISTHASEPYKIVRLSVESCLEQYKQFMLLSTLVFAADETDGGKSNN